MILDCHVHTQSPQADKSRLIEGMDAANIDQCILLSYSPKSFCTNGGMKGVNAGYALKAEESLSLVMEFASYNHRIIPFFWIDPVEEDACEQVEMAVKAGIRGFKVIHNRCFPGDERAMKVYRKIAETGKPILFHSGILYGNGPCSQYNRPIGFEYLLDIPNLRFALAHVSWPWHDECIALYGYWQNRKEGRSTTTEMFIDTTPGTPKIYRQEVFQKLYTVGYRVEDNLLFGTDCNHNYDPDYAKSILEMDREVLDRIGVTAAQREKYYGKNLLRFLGD